MAALLVNKFKLPVQLLALFILLVGISAKTLNHVGTETSGIGEGGDKTTQAEAAQPLEVFIIPHSHMDVGWVYTVKESMDAYVIDAYNTVVDALSKNSTRRFIAVEQEFFRLWWTQVANSTQKSQVHRLVKSGQLEFVIGGQVMHDEAMTEYSATIQQMTDGNAFIYETFGVRPHFSWQIDPFGASAATPTLFAMMGFDAHLIDRIGYDTKQAMMQNKSLQFVWQASPSLGSDKQIFTHVMDSYRYCMPDTLSNGTGFFWNGYAVFPKPADGHYPHMSTPVNASNVKQIANYMVSNIKERAAWFATPHLMWPWGCDKQFFNATIMFENMDRLMDHINSHSTEYGVKLRYATVGEYFKTIHNINRTWSLKEDGDFLPYSADFDSAWTGFYASHGALKGLARSAQATLHAGEGLFTIYNYQAGKNATLNKTSILHTLKGLREASAEVQHHDGITGTMSPKVYDMYHNNLWTNRNQTRHVMAEMIKELLSGGDKDSGIRLAVASSDEGQNILLNADGKKMVPMVAYNPLGWLVRRLMPVNISTPNVSVIDIHGRTVGSQVNPPLGPKEPYRLFIYVQLPPLTYDTYYIVYNTTQNSSPLGNIQRNPAKSRSNRDNQTRKDETVAISNDCFVVTYDNKTNMMMSITDKQSGTAVPMEHLFREYNAQHNVLLGQAVNNYVFRPMGAAQAVGDMVKLDIITGPYVNETVQSFYNFYDPDNSRYSVTLRLHDLPHMHEDQIVCGHIELDFRIGPLYANKELIYRFKTQLSSSKILYTDVNGFQAMKRVHKVNATEPIAQNYFPMVSRTYIQDEAQDLRLTLLSERAHGVGSLENGEIEVLLHRRIINNEFESHDYNLTLNDTSVMTSTLWLLLGNCTHSSQLQHEAWLQLENPPHMIAVNVSTSAGSAKESKKDGAGLLNNEILVRQWIDRYRPHLSSVPVFKKLPPNLHLLTLKIPGWNFTTNHTTHMQELQEKVKHNIHSPPELNLDRVLVRLHHVFEKNEHPTLSKPASINLADFLSPLGEVDTIEERSLTTTWDVKNMNRWKWTTKGNKVSPSSPPADSIDRPEGNNPAVNPTSEITLKPQEIKTFFVTFKKKQ